MRHRLRHKYVQYCRCGLESKEIHCVASRGLGACTHWQSRWESSSAEVTVTAHPISALTHQQLPGRGAKSMLVPRSCTHILPSSQDFYHGETLTSLHSSVGAWACLMVAPKENLASMFGFGIRPCGEAHAWNMPPVYLRTLSGLCPF